MTSFPPSDDNLGSASRSSAGSSGSDEPTRLPGSGSGVGRTAAGVPLGPSIEGYVLKEEIHRGGQGIVYRALQLGTKRQVALKVLLEGPFASEGTLQRFQREVELAASLRHPNIVTILDSGLSLGRYYFAMEYIDGVRLDRYLAQKRPTLDHTLALCEKVCLAINFAHQHGVIHRDLKPPNILVDNEGEPHILDFGLAKPMNRADPSQSTIQVLSTAGQLIGTVAFMSPEQAAGLHDVDLRSDVYSLGVIFYDALVGRPPYSVEGPLGEVLRRIADDEPANPRSLTGRGCSGIRIDDEVATILLKALEKEPQRRYQTAGDLARDIRRRLDGEPIEAKRASGLYMLKKTLRRYRLQAATAGLILLMLIGSLVTFAALFASQREARRRADENTEIARMAVKSQDAALQEARDRTADAVLAGQKLRRALVREHIQRGDLALQRLDLSDARDSYWDAMEVAPGPAAIWALRRYHLQAANSGTAMLTLESHGPVKLSPGGQFAAVCADPRSVCVQRIDSAAGAAPAWVCTPGPVTKLDITDAGALAANGPGWACVWPPGTLCPSVSASLAEGTNVEALFAVDEGHGLLLVGRETVRLVRGAVGESSDVMPLLGAPTGPADYAPHSGELAIPTAAGVELVTIAGDRLRHSVAWSDPQHPPVAVRFDDDRLAVLADGVYVRGGQASGGEGENAREWKRVADLPPVEPIAAAGPGEQARWDLFDFKEAGEAVVFATHTGQVSVLHQGDESVPWRFAVDRLVEIRLSMADGSVTTLDDRGTATRWIRPDRIEQRRTILTVPPATWASSADGSCVLMADGRGRVVAYRPDQVPIPRTVLRPRLLGNLPGLGEQPQLSLAVSGDGRRAVISDASAWRFCDLDEQTTRARTWSHPTLTVVDRVALSHDGVLSALLVRSTSGDQQRIALRRWPTSDDDPAEEASESPQPAPFDFVGALIRDMAFVPQSHTLLMVRSNGQLFLLDAEGDARPPAIPPIPTKAWELGSTRANAGQPPTSQRTAPTPPPSLEPWMQLDSPPTALAFSRAGEYLAVAGEDDVVRVISLKRGGLAGPRSSQVTMRGQVRHRISAARGVSALAFNPRDDVLMIRTVDGVVHLYDPVTGESIAEWPLPVATQHPLAAWIGDADAMLLGDGDGVYEHRYDQADTLIERGRPYARQRQIVQQIKSGDIVAAWATAAQLSQLDPDLGRWARLNILEIALRRPHVAIPLDWIESVLDDRASAATYIRLGHAAYDGERFDSARRWLQRGRELARDVADAGSPAQDQERIDAFTLWRIAECDYLFGANDQAEAELAAVLRRPDFNPALVPTVALQRVAALALAGRAAEARQAAPRVSEPDAWGRYGDSAAGSSARIIARVMTGLEDETLAAATLDNLLAAVDERSLLYLDDARFYAGELERQRGDLAQAAVQYQQCIDLARDPWPANWARFRLAQLAQQPQ